MKTPFASSAAAAGASAVILSLVVQNLGASYAKALFATIGVVDTVALRLGLSAVILVLLRRAWRSVPSGKQAVAILLYGLALAAMNSFIYQAFARLPIGLAVAIEVLGPMAVATLGMRRFTDLIWPFVGLVALALLIPIGGAQQGLDPMGIAFAVGASLAWAGYILAGKRAAQLGGADALSWGMVTGSLLVVPLALSQGGGHLLNPSLLWPGLVVAVLSGVTPYGLEMWAMHRLTVKSLGLLLSAAPAVAAIIGWLCLGETLSSQQWVALLLVVVSMAGQALLGGRRPPNPG